MGFFEYLDNLPEPLEKEEQRQLLKEFYETRDESIREKLITHNLRLAASCLFKAIGRGRDIEDYMQIATIELMNVLDNKYDITRGVEFSTFAYSCILGRLLAAMSARGKSPDVLNLPFEQMVDYSVLKEADKDFDENDFINKVARQSLFEEFYSQLDEDDKFLLDHFYGYNGAECMEAKSIAKHLNKSVSLMYVRLRELKKDLQRYIDLGGQIPEKVQRKSLLKYYHQTDNSMHKDILEHYLGIDGKEECTLAQIPNHTKYAPHVVYEIMREITKESALLEGYINITTEDYLKYNATCSDLLASKVLELHLGLSCRTRDYLERIGTTGYEHREIKVPVDFDGVPTRYKGIPKLDEYGIADELKLKTYQVGRILKHIDEEIIEMKAKERVTGVPQLISFADLEDYCKNLNAKDRLFMSVLYGIGFEHKLDINTIAKMFSMSTTKVRAIKNEIEDDIRQKLLYNIHER